MRIIKYLKRIIFIILLLLGLLYLCTANKTEAADVYTIIRDEVAAYNSDPVQIDWITQAICYTSNLYAVDPLLITAVMETESHFHFTSVSPVGAIGLMQLMPDTARSLGVDPYNPLENVIGGTYYLRLQLDNFASWGEYAVTDAVAAYNAGPQAVIEYGGCPPYNETINYCIKVAEAYNDMLSRFY